ncbi:UbiH/UbiF family hydroxylase [Tritonibacter horizontis]|uniref:2-octaprenyl-3-methyl-6-methoxy-1,4-benzoquinol hydroxylase n=1 Tax=Tritonibacter horizontis TaxID=1768241 RepID=A0A132C1N8_9RHOB|nr:UbiH/UbiF family hydroxylase [Tritonibacter horizontis]KUP93970.1 2-octaprenyl-3-methyl-6-methoxy-1,4-benzoquinol hydroxylase [Tritonibacter horizontis]
MSETCDILISGGGIAGLTAATVFATHGFSVICVDPSAPITARDAAGADLRTTAFLQPAKALLEEAGLWADLADQAAPLQVMRIVDAGGPVPEPRVIREFDAAEVSDLPFGWNLPNWLLRRVLLTRIEQLPQVAFRPGIGTTRLFTRTGGARVTLSDGSRVSCKLVLACDGRNSPMREAAGIGVKTTRYGQKALAFAVSHDLPHHNVSTEIHRTGGPFTLVPLPDHEGRASSAVVWMETSANADRLAALTDAAFEAEMTERSCAMLGPLTLASRRTLWPIITQQADRLTAERIALMAEAAHVVPPIGAQGLNMSLADLRALLDLALARPDGLGDQTMLDAYARTRQRDITLRVNGIDLLNRASMTEARPLRDLRAQGLNALYALPQVRHVLMQMGLGVR